MKGNPKKFLINIAIILFSISIGITMLEISAKIIWKKKYNQYLKKELHGYEYVDDKRSIIIPKANIKKTVEQHRADLVAHGKIAGLENFEESIQNSSLSNSTVLFSINKYGFKGPEFLLPKPKSVFRILTIGDSCTWGSVNEYYTYPRSMEREFKRLVNKCKVEVVNAGFLGYNFERVIKRIDEYLVAEPDLITIYLGWNRTIARADSKKNLWLYRHFALYKSYYHFVINRTDTGLQANYKARTFYNENDPSLDVYRNYSFKYDIKDLNTLLGIIKRKNQNIKVVLITLAGMFDLRVSPDEHALEAAYPIASTNNLCAWGVLTKRYNDELKKYAKAHQIDVINFETYALNNFVPRSAYFSDSVHPNNEGYLKMGRYFTSKLSKYIPYRNP